MIEWIVVDRIKDPAELLRRINKDSQIYKDIRASIKTGGYWESEPIEVCAHEEQGFFKIIEGRHRLNAGIDEGLEKIAAVVVPYLTDAQVLERGLAIQSLKVPLKPSDEARAVRKVQALYPGITAVDLAKKVGHPENVEYVKKLLKISNLGGEAARLVNEGEVSLSKGEMLSDLLAAGGELTPQVMAQAKSETLEAFRGTINGLLARVPKHEPPPKPRRLPDVRQELERCLKDPNTHPERIKALQWFFRQDPASAAAQGLTPPQDVARDFVELVHWGLGSGASLDALQVGAETRSVVNGLDEGFRGQLATKRDLVASCLGVAPGTVDLWASGQVALTYANRRKVLTLLETTP